jgi:hypothetical protein
MGHSKMDRILVIHMELRGLELKMAQIHFLKVHRYITNGGGLLGKTMIIFRSLDILGRLSTQENRAMVLMHMNLNCLLGLAISGNQCNLGTVVIVGALLIPLQKTITV